MDRTRYAGLFRSESREHLAAITRLLLDLEREPGRADTVADLFRSVHTLKGAAAAMGYAAAADVAHGLEDLLEGMRRGAIRADAGVIDLLLQGADALESAIDAPESEPPAALLARLAEAGGGAAKGPGAASGGGAFPADESRDAAAGMEVIVQFESDCALPAVRAAMALRAARGLGRVSAVRPDEDAIHAGEMAGELRFSLAGEVDAERVAAAMRGVGEVAAVEVRAAERTAPGQRIDEGPIARVPQARLDAVVDQVGELMIARDRLRRVAACVASAELDEALEGASKLVDGLREEIMRLRMVPVGEVFDRFPRMVRDAARALGRRVELRIDGQEEEVDRGLLNEVSDLLVHLLRNAVDHGIEPPEERRAAGKPEVGVIRLSAEREGSAVRLRVEDDGRGLQRQRILAAGRARGLLAPEAGDDLSDAEVWKLVTMPGFSTSDRVSDVSGRGVGLDIVRSRAQALGGGLEIRSEAGRGAVFILRLPLSLTLIRALRFSAGGAYYSVPLAAVVEVAEVEPDGEDRILVRGASLPAVDLRWVLSGGEGVDLLSNPLEAALGAALVLEVSGARAAVVVDAVVGHHQAVVKRFDAPLRRVDLFSGATVLPDGRPSLILDPARLLTMAGGGVTVSMDIDHAERTGS